MDKRQKALILKIKLFAGTVLFLPLAFCVPWLVMIPDALQSTTPETILPALQTWAAIGPIDPAHSALADRNALVVWAIGTAVCLAAVVFLMVSLKVKPTGKWGPPVAGAREFGSSHFMIDKEKTARTAVWHTKEQPKRGGIVFGREQAGRHERIYYDPDDTHTLIIGATRSGKSRRLILPTIWQLGAAGESMIVSDPKSELRTIAQDYLLERGYEVLAIDLREPATSDQWNPLQLVADALRDGNEPAAERYAEDIGYALTSHVSSTTDPIWPTTARAVVKALALLVASAPIADAQKNLYSCITILGNYGAPDGEGDISLYRIIDALPVDHPARRAWLSAKLAEGKLRSSIFVNALSDIQLFGDSNIARITAAQGFKMDAIAEEKAAVFLIAPDERPAYNGLVTLFVEQLFQRMVQIGNQSGGRIPRRINFLLDEAGNLPPIPALASKLTIAGGRGMRFHLALQDFAQFDKLYGLDSKTIRGNCHNWIYLSTSDVGTAKLISERLGRYTIKVAGSSSSTSTGDRSCSSHSTTLQSRALLQEDEVMRWRPDVDGVIVSRSREHPAMYELPDLSKWAANAAFGMGSTQAQNVAIMQRRAGLLPRTIHTMPESWLPTMPTEGG